MAVIDLRSDTVTVPTPAMRRAMQQAEVGDDVYGDDPTVNQLEALAAEMLGKEAAVYVPSGTMANACAVFAHCGRGDQLIVGRNAHIMLNEQGGAAVLASAMPFALDEAEDGTLALADVDAAVQSEDDHHVNSKMVAIENTHNVRGGRPLTPDYTDALADLVHGHGLVLHVDGARLFNAAAALDVPAARLVAQADSVSVCLSKGLSAPVGSLVVGTAAFVARARRARKLLGGGMRQAGIVAAAGIVALTTMTDRLKADHQNAQDLAVGLAAIPEVALNLANVCTNMVYFDVTADAPVDADGLSRELARRDVLIGATGKRRLRACTHYWITPVMIERTIETVREVMR